MAVGARRPDRGVARDRGDPARRRCPTRSRSSTSASTGSATSRDPERVFQVVRARAWRASSRRCARSTRSRATCPGQLTSFVGREDRARGDRRRAARRSRLVTITGVGGVGKTPPRDAGRARGAAALPRRRVAVRARDRAATTKSSAQVVAATLGVLPRPGDVARRQHHRRVAHARARCSCSTTASTSSTPVGRLAEGLLRDVSAACAILATSREALGVAGEQVWPLRLARLPAHAADVDGRSRPSEAVRLFVERARGGAARLRARRDRTRRRSPRSVAGSTASRSRSSSPRRGSRS